MLVFSTVQGVSNLLYVQSEWETEAFKSMPWNVGGVY